MTNQSREAFEAKRMAEQVYALLRLGNHVKYSNTTVALLTERFAAALSEGRRLVADDLAWADEFIVEPEWFPNEGDRQAWRERRCALMVKEGKV